jgi:hypothetical protein
MLGSTRANPTYTCGRIDKKPNQQVLLAMAKMRWQKQNPNIKESWDVDTKLLLVCLFGFRSEICSELGTLPRDNRSLQQRKQLQRGTTSSSVLA